MAARDSVDLLRLVRMFASLPDAMLDVIAERCRRTSVPAGSRLIQAGDVPAELSIVVSGELRVVNDRDHRPGGHASAIDVIARGASVGESVIDGSMAPFSVYAAGDAELLQLPAVSLRALLAEEPQIEIALRDYAIAREGLDDDLARDAGHRDADPGDRYAGHALAANRVEDFPAADPLAWTTTARPPSRRRFAARHPHVRQEQPADAGAACLAAVSRFYGRRIGLARLRDLAAEPRTPADLHSLQRGAEAIGYEAIAGRATYQHLASNQLPAIVGCAGSHWLVVYRAQPDAVVIADPARGVRTLRREAFERRWSGETLYLRPTSRVFDIQESRQTLERFLPYVRPLFPLVAEVVIASIVIQLLNLLFPLFAKFVVDDVIARADTRWLGPSLIAMTGVLVVYLATSLSRRYLLDFVSRQVDARLAGDFYRHLLSLPLPFFETKQVGDVVGRFEETGRITQFLTRTGVGLFIDLVTAMLYVTLMAHYNLRLTGAVLLLLAVEVTALYLVTPRMEQGSRDLSEQAVDGDGLLIESLSGLKTIKILAIEHYVRWGLQNAAARVANQSLAALPSRTLSMVTTEVVANLGTLAVLFYGSILVLRNTLTVGELVAFGILTRGLITPFAQLVGVWAGLQDALRSVEQINDVLDQPSEWSAHATGDHIVLRTLQGHVRFDAVTFRYRQDGPPVLRDVSFECYGGQRVAILGRSGSGKSTMVKLLLGLHRPSAGTISVDGFDLQEIWTPSLRRQTGVVLQEPTLFRGSIRANITQTMPTAPLSEVVTAATLANAHHFVSALPQGYETEIDENGANLSGGQRQQIALARAMLHTPRMLILDEATSNLDTESARLFQQNLDESFRDSTVITITQRLAAARHADLILVLDRGMLVEQGMHDDLLSQQGLYYQLTEEHTV